MKKQKLNQPPRDPNTTDISVENLLKQGNNITMVPENSGLMGTDSSEEPIAFVPAVGQRVIRNRNAFIVLGKDRPSTRASGFGGIGAKECDAIDIVVGRGLNLPPEAKKPEIMNNSFFADSSRIYISSLTNIDKNFGIADGLTGQVKGRSGIGIKSDTVRIIGREGIKIVTGKAQAKGFGKFGERNSRRGKISSPAAKIELLAGNNDGFQVVRGGIFTKKERINNVQPVVRGENLEHALVELGEMLEKALSAIENLAFIQTSFNAIISVNPLPWYPAAGVVATAQSLTSVIANLHMQRVNAAFWSLNYCTPVGYKYVCSQNVSAT